MTADPAAGATVPTYRGTVGAGVLGRTLMHEHVFVRSPELDVDYPHPEWDQVSAVETAVRGLEDLYDLGIRTVVDLTVPGLGRDVALVARVAARVRVNLVAATGWYTDDVLPPFFRTHGPGRLVGGTDPLTDFFLRDVQHGIGTSGVRAGVVKVVTDAPGMTPDVTRILTAAATVHAETGVLISTHSNPALGTGLDQARFLLDRAVRADHLIIGHSGDSTDLDQLRRLLGMGVTLGFDRFGMAHTGEDQQRVDTLLTLLGEGYAGQLVVSHDAAYFSRVTPPSWRRSHTPHWTHDHLSRRILPLLLERGARQEDLDTMMIDNPARLLAPVAR
ncbi:phosphotriesterase family protein [Nocardioides insulae]|uniref:phosphotriesterase family protein n=1 Tax=Nocardioides insulae TaxID=394734 RepID=UPI0003FFACC9|nr:hypothetical protein [Nocardioides insulae]